MVLKDKNVLVLGGGKSGLALVDFLLSRGAAVTLADDKKLDGEELTALEERGLRCIFQQSPTAADYDFCTISPGVPLTHATAQSFIAAQKPLIGEAELASRFIKAPIIGVTGTNGKTTTTTLIGEILKAAGYKTFVGGNIGTPLTAAIGGDYDYIVVEMSSFQLETIQTMDVFVSLYLNLTPDHLNRHGTMEGYLAAKANMALHQSAGHFTVLNADDHAFDEMAHQVKSHVVCFSAKDTVYEGTSLRFGQDLVCRLGKDMSHDEQTIINKDKIAIRGPHNLENALGAVTVARILNLEPAVIRRTLQKFSGVEHRLEKVRVLRGVTYINDSKATNPDAAIKALQSFPPGKIVWLAGGRNKGVAFDTLAQIVQERARHVILTGEAAPELAQALAAVGYTDFEEAPSMESAIRRGAKLAEKGDFVLLSPANTSFDWYKNYELRGEDFKRLVKALK